MANPNGDLDTENRPRMDNTTNTNLVSDVRLKRYIRDYLEFFKGEDLFISTHGNIAAKKEKEAKKNSIDYLKKKGKDPVHCIDVKFFGAVLAEEGSATHFVGPIQFNWGYSLNKVNLTETKSVVSSISEEGIGEDFRVKYSFIAFSGSINGKNAEQVELNDNDINLFDEAIIRAIPLSKTRSKIGQMPRLYLRVEMKDGKFLKDLREFLYLDEIKNLSSIHEVILNADKLNEYLIENKANVEKIYLYQDKALNIKNLDLSSFNVEELKF